VTVTHLATLLHPLLALHELFYSCLLYHVAGGQSWTDHIVVAFVIFVE